MRKALGLSICCQNERTTHLCYGGCDEGGDGSVSTFFDFDDEDYEWEWEDIDLWYEIPDPRIDGNIE